MRRAVVVIVLLLAGCGREGSGPGDTAGRGVPDAAAVTAVSLERFEDCPELVGHLRAEATKRVGPYGIPGSFMGGAVLEAQGAPMAAESADSARSAAPGAGGFSQTNIQEAGVDEPDIVKSDGRSLFMLRPDPANAERVRLTSISVEGGQPRLSGSVQLPSGPYAYELLLADDRLLAIAQGGFAIARRGGAELAPPQQEAESTIVAVVDVADPAEMRVTNILRLDGTYASARMVEGIARIVLNSTSTRLPFESPAGATADDEKTALERNKEIIERAGAEDWLPRFEIEDAEGEPVDDGPLTTCATTYRPKAFSGFGTVSVVTLDPRDPDPRNSAAVLGSAGIVYASTQNLYVSTQRWPQPEPLVIGNAPIGAPESIPTPPDTSLHRFDISDPTRASYAASGEVKGTVLNQWSLSEHDGHLRVATTEEGFGPEGPPSSSSFVTVLTARGPRMSEVGSVGDIGPGERIYGVRYIGDLGYVVTFRQIDPLHVIDLSVPTRPRVLGELEIPGYSAYLHPVGDGLLLGVGQDATQEGGTLGTQLSLFDVRDPNNPRRLDKVRIDGSNTLVEHDHHAFLWWEPASLAVLPIQRFSDVVTPDRPTSSEDSKRAPDSFAGGFRVRDGEIEEVGRAVHSRSTEFAGIQRSLVVDGTLFTVSGGGVLASDLDSFDERGWLAFEAAGR